MLNKPLQTKCNNGVNRRGHAVVVRQNCICRFLKYPAKITPVTVEKKFHVIDRGAVTLWPSKVIGELILTWKFRNTLAKAACRNEISSNSLQSYRGYRQTDWQDISIKRTLDKLYASDNTNMQLRWHAQIIPLYICKYLCTLIPHSHFTWSTHLYVRMYVCMNTMRIVHIYIPM